MSRVVSRRAVLALVAAFGISALFGNAAQAAKKKAPNLEGEWQGVLHFKGFGDLPFTLDITDQKKNGKFEGTATTPGQEPYDVSGKVNPNRKVKAVYQASINGQPTWFALNVTVSRDKQTAEGTVRGEDEEGNTVITGTVEMERVPDEG